MLVEFTRAPSARREYGLSNPGEDGEDDGLANEVTVVDAPERKISIRVELISRVFESEREPGVTIVQLHDGRGGVRVKGTFDQVTNQIHAATG